MRCKTRICTKAGLTHLPIVVLMSIQVVTGCSPEAHRIDAVIETASTAPAPANPSRTLIGRSAPRGSELSVSIFGALGNNVDDAIDCIRSPDRASGPANHLDPFDIFKKQVLYVPRHPGIQRSVDAAAIDQDQHRF